MNGWIRTSSSPIRVARWTKIRNVSATVWWRIDFPIARSSHRADSNASAYKKKETNPNSQLGIHSGWYDRIQFFTNPLILDMVSCFDYCYFSVCHRFLYFERLSQTALMCFHPAKRWERKQKPSQLIIFTVLYIIQSNLLIAVPNRPTKQKSKIIQAK